MRNLLFVVLAGWVGVLGAQAFQPHTFDSLWYYDEGDRTYYRGLFRVDTVTQNFYVLSQMEEVDGVGLWGIVGDTGVFGIKWNDQLYNLTGKEFVLQTQYPGQGAFPPQDVDVAYFGGDTLLLVTSSQSFGLGPPPSGLRWFTQRIKSIPGFNLSGSAFSPTDVTDVTQSAVYTLATNGVLFQTTLLDSRIVSPPYRFWGDTVRAVKEDLFIYDLFDPALPFEDTVLAAEGWNVTGAPVWKGEVQIGGFLWSVFEIPAGASISKSSGVPLPLVEGVRGRVVLLPRSGDVFELALGSEIRMISDGAEVQIVSGGDTVTVDTLGALRTVADLQFRVTAETLLVNYGTTPAIARVLSGGETIDQVSLSVSGGAVLLDRVTFEVDASEIEPIPGSSFGLWVGTSIGLFRFDGTTWTSTGFSDPVDDVVVFSQNAQKVLVLSGGKVFLSSDGGSSFNDVTPVSEGDEVRKVVGTPDGSRLLAATSDGLYLSVDGGQTWNAVQTSMDRWVPEAWAKDVRDVLWKGDSLIMVVNRGGVFASSSGFGALEEWNYSGVRPTFLDPDRRDVLVRVLEDSTFTVNGNTYNGLWSALQALLGAPGNDLDGDPRVVLLLADMGYDLTAGLENNQRIPSYETVNPGLWQGSPYAMGREVAVLDIAHREGDFNLPIDYGLPEDPGNPNLRNGFNAVVRALAKTLALTHNLTTPRWLLEGIARYAEYGVFFGGDSDPDTTLTEVGFAESYGFTDFPAVWSLEASEPVYYRNARYAFLQFLRDVTSDFSVKAMLLSGDPVDYITSTTGMTFSELLEAFADSLAGGRIDWLPNVEPVMIYVEEVSGRGRFFSDLPVFVATGEVRAVPMVGYMWGRYTFSDDTQIDTLFVNVTAGEELSLRLYLMNAPGDVTLLGAATVNGDRDTAFVLNQSVQSGQEIWVAVIWSDSTRGVRQRLRATSVRLVLSDTSWALPPVDTVKYLITQDPLYSNRMLFRALTSQPVYVESEFWPTEVVPPEAVLIREVESDRFGAVDTSFTIVTPEQPVYVDPGVRLFNYQTQFTERGKEVWIFARDAYGRAVLDHTEFFQPLELEPGQTFVASAEGVRVRIPEGAVERPEWAVVREIEDPEVFVDYLSGLNASPVKMIQVGSAAISLRKPAEITMEGVPAGARVYRFTPQGWEEVSAVPAGANRIKVQTYGLGLFAVVEGQEIPVSLQVRLLSPMLRRGQPARIFLALPDARSVRVEVMDGLGRRVRTFSRRFQAGFHEIQLPTRDMATGVYFLRMRVGQEGNTSRVVVLP